MTTPQQSENLIGLTAVDSDGDKVGKVGQVYLDDATGQPVWVTVSSGMLGNRQSFAPLYDSAVRSDQLVLAVPKQMVKDAPSVENDGHLDEAEINALYQHYAGHLDPSYGSGAGQSGDEDPAGRHAEDAVAGAAEGDPPARAEGYDTSGPVTDDAMTRSEERLRVGTENVQTGRARLRKYVVTETVTTTVPVSHEEVRLEREPITDTNRDAALSGADISEEEHEVVLHAERPVVAKETVPVERVRLSTDTVTGEQEVTEQVRKEQIDEPEVDGESGIDPQSRASDR
ncbi:MAG: DUF2382 domain-containing protein [Streptosporangiaceae bacterium]